MAFKYTESHKKTVACMLHNLVATGHGSIVAELSQFIGGDEDKFGQRLMSWSFGFARKSNSATSDLRRSAKTEFVWSRFSVLENEYTESDGQLQARRDHQGDQSLQRKAGDVRGLLTRIRADSGIADTNGTVKTFAAALVSFRADLCMVTAGKGGAASAVAHMAPVADAQLDPMVARLMGLEVANVGPINRGNRKAGAE